MRMKPPARVYGYNIIELEDEKMVEFSSVDFEMNQIFHSQISPRDSVVVGWLLIKAGLRLKYLPKWFMWLTEIRLPWERK